MDTGTLETVVKTWGPLVSIIAISTYVISRDLRASRGDSAGGKYVERGLDRVTVLEDQVAHLRDQVAELEREQNKLVLENERLRDRLAMMEGTHMDLPWPMWIKDRNGIMLAVNPAYEQQFLIPRGYTKDDYIGSDDYAIWPDDIAASFQAHDRDVMETGRLTDFREEVDMPNGRELKRFLKFPRLLGTSIVGIAGIHIPDERAR